MKQRCLWLAALLVLAGCGFRADNYKKVANDFLVVLREVNDLLESVRSGQDAQRAVGKIEQLSIRVDELTLRVKKLPPAMKETATLEDDFKAKRDREYNRFRTVQQRLHSSSDTAIPLQRPMMQFSKAVFDLDLAVFDYSSRSFRHSVTNPGGPSNVTASSTPQVRPQPAQRPAGPDAFELARRSRMRQLADKHGSNRVAMVRIVELSPAANRAKLFDEVRASAKVQDTSMTVSPDELTVFMAPVADLKAVADRVPFGKVTRIDTAARTITVSMKQPK
jgi:hypothetical protein